MPALSGYTELNTFRYERKYAVDTLNSFQVEQIIRLHNAGFSEIFHQRYINNIYFDTPGFDFYYDNAEGRDNRVKFRIRWYGDLFAKIEKPILEMKIKRGMVGTKRSFLLKTFTFTRDFNLKELLDIIKDSGLPEDVLLRMKHLKPAILNRYQRKYFRDFSRLFRITIDKDISYFPARDQLNIAKFPKEEEGLVVVELKYDKELNNEATEISNGLPFRLTKNSKYVRGIESFYEVID